MNDDDDDGSQAEAAKAARKAGGFYRRSAVGSVEGWGYYKVFIVTKPIRSMYMFFFTPPVHE